MKLRFRSALPPLDRTARLPLALAALLVAALVMQFAVAVEPVELPQPGPVGRAGVSDTLVADPGRATGGAVILARSMFAPSGDASAGGASPLQGTTIVGSIRVGRSTFAVVQGPGNRTSRVPVGGRIGEWRLRAVRANEALLHRGGEEITVAFGAGTPLPANAAATGSPR